MITKEQAFGMYIGRDVKTDSVTDRLNGIKYSVSSDVFVSVGHTLYNINDCKLILRPFEDMDDMEMSIFNAKYKDEVDTNKHYKLTTNSIEYLISIGIDVFNLRDRGWAVYKSDIKETTK